jgi:hypothetical protein
MSRLIVSNRSGSSPPMPQQWGWRACGAVLSLAMLNALLSACGGASGSSPAAAVPGETVGASDALIVPQVTTTFASAAPESAPMQMAMQAQMPMASLFSLQSISMDAAPAGDAGTLMLLLPDDQNMSDPRVAAWLDAASELGIRIQPLTDAQFMALGTAAQAYAGLVLPDGLHVQASDAIVQAVHDYTQQGGRTMLVFDFGALTTLNGTPVYPVPKSRLSGLAGVDYVLYDALRDRTTGLGPVTALRSTLRNLQVPPGKSLPFNGIAAVSATSPTTSSSTSSTSTSTKTSPLLSAARISAQSALYLPVSTRDAGGANGFDPQQYAALRYASSGNRTGTVSARKVRIDLGRAIQAEPVTKITSSPLSSLTAMAVTSAAASVDQVDAYNGYLLGPLIYPSYVTQGDFGGLPGQQVLATSPQFGLVAGVNPVGAGQVLFVNLPLTYLKGRTDALMMHGYLHYFAHNMLGMAHLSAMPNGVAGMTLDWHLDAMAAQAPTNNLIKLNVFNDPQALFSIEMTAGPDAITPGDRLGWNLRNNKKAQQFLKTFQTAGHSVGSHGGWIHDYYGINVSETNQLLSTNKACVNSVIKVDNYLQCLVLNRQAVDGVTGKGARSYSAPEGNNPLWAMDWLEKQGVVATYFGGHTGLGATRQYREGQLLNPSIWVFPVTPAGLYATFEEFQDYKVPKTDISTWYRDLINFSVAQNTSRMVYAHPPGAALWSDVLKEMLAYAKAQGPKFAWYTMPRLADFMARRLAVTWSQSTDPVSGQTLFSASHPAGLQEMVWRLPKARYANAPVVVSGVATVDVSDAAFWLVKAGAGTQLVFRA